MSSAHLTSANYKCKITNVKLTINNAPAPALPRFRSRLPNGNLRSQVGQLLAVFSEMFDEVASEQ
jgi:hypothetical protein